MSWNTAKKRFQMDLNRYPEYLRKAIQAKHPQATLPTMTEPRFVPTKERKTTMEQVGIVSGDMAYVTEGEFKGKITSVLRYSDDSDCFFLSDALEKKIVPQGMWSAEQTSHIIDYPAAVKGEHVKLAAKDKDEQGNITYVVADEIVYKEKYYDHNYRKWLPRRFVKHHEHIEIPWPRPPVEPEEDALSTPKEAALEKTYELQTIAKPPFPSSVLAELRNPYSRHKKVTLTEAQARRLNAPKMPLTKEQKIYLAKKAQAPVKKPQPLSDEIKDFIGSKMAQHLSTIDNPYLLAHLNALSKQTLPEMKQDQKPKDEAEQ